MNVEQLFNRLITFFVVLTAFVCLCAIAEAAEKEPPRYNKESLLNKSFKISGTKESVDPEKIGIILPLTGKDSAYGNRALDAIFLGAGIFDVSSNTPFKLIIEDSKSSREAAEKAVTKLADIDGAICIIGPMEGPGDEAAAKEAQRLKIPILTLTPKNGITDVGDYVFINFLTNKMQVKSLVKYAINDLGSTRFAILYPNNLYGQEMKDLFQSEVLRSGGEVIKVQSCDASQTDFGVEISALTNEEKHNELAEESLKRIISFDTLFLPGSYVYIKLIASQLAVHNITGIQLLGTTAWNNSDLAKAGSGHLEGAVFVDGFFLNSFHPEVNDFTDMYYAAFGREPDFIDAISFDTIKIVTRILGGRQIDTREKFKKALLKLEDYHGVTGRTSFLQRRDAEKEAFILTIKNGQIIQVK